MEAPSGGWHLLEPGGDGSLSGACFSVRARTQSRADELWINIESPDGSWTYVIVREGEVVAHEQARTKREAYRRVVEAVAQAPVG
jgi:hypothetical protein